MQNFLKKLMKAAVDAGLEACEAYVVERDSFRAMTSQGEITEYKSNLTRGLGFRGMKNGRMGYASTEAFDDEAIDQLVRGVLESAELCEDTDQEFLYQGSDPVPQLSLQNDELAQTDAEAKIARLQEMDRVIRQNAKVERSANNTLQSGRYIIHIVNSYGMDRSYTEDMCLMFGEAVAKEGAFVSSGFYGKAARDMAALDPKAIGEETARRAVNALNAKPVPSGKYRVVIHGEAMTDLLSTFDGIFSAESAQKDLSLLKGRLGEKIAADCITLVDDPLLPGGLASRPFDDEGVPSQTTTVIENGVFKTFLHNLKTAHKAGVSSTGNASKASYSAPVHVAPSNFSFRPGSRCLEEMLASIGDGIVITEVSGLHAGANPLSGDFSLLSKGYAFHNGQRTQAVEQITVAGNFYDLLKNAREAANDLVFPMGGTGSPSIDVGELSISGC